jgi:ATP-dependent exoDNAse (exonuclease V) alpha subunit
VRKIGAGKGDSIEDVSLDYTGFNLEDLEREKAERKQQASHIVHIVYEDESFDDISAAGDFAKETFSLGYALTVHKAQGSEWRKVFIVLHKDFAISLYRELFYTAVTRARTKVTIIAKDMVVQKAIKNQRIKGNTLKDKLEYFNSGADMRDGIYTTK